MIHEVSHYYDSSPFVSRPTSNQSSNILTDVTSRTNNTQSSDAAAAARKGYYPVIYQCCALDVN